jgi:hypothetical protein
MDYYYCTAGCITMTKSEKYEKLIKKIADEIRKASKNLCNAKIYQGLKNKIEGNSGYKHQIDVSITTNDKLVLIECKKREEKVGLGDTLILIARVDDIRKKHPEFETTGLFFTTEGYTKNALTLAEAYRIVCNTAKSESDFAAQIANNVLIGAKTLYMKLKLPKQKVITNSSL